MIRRISVIFFVVMLCASIWWIGPFVAIGKWRPLTSVWVRALLITPILLCVAVPLLLHTSVRTFGRLRNAIHRAPSQPDVMTQRSLDAMATLKYLGLGEQRDALSKIKWRIRRAWLTDRPWFVVAGPDNSGKTSMLSESQQLFFQAGQYCCSDVISMGGTRDVNWWLSRQAVWIDTPGKWSQSLPEGDKERRALMRLLRRHRSYPVLDGIFLCLNAQTLLNASPTDYSGLINDLRSSLLDFAVEARSDLPVYLMLTHLDALPGGKILLRSLDEALINTGIGFSLADEKTDSTNTLQTLQARISHYVLELLHRVSTDEDRQQLLALTETLGALTVPLRNLVLQVFPLVSAGYSVKLRHIWLGSSTQLAEQIDILAAWDVSQEVYTGNGLWQAAFRHAITERHILQSGRPPGTVLSRLRRGFSWMLAFALLFSGSVWLINCYQWEKEFVSYLKASFDETRRLVMEIPASNRPGDNLIAAYKQLGYINVHLEDNTTPLANPYIEHRLLTDAVKATWHRHLLKNLWPAVESYVVSTLQQEIQTPDSDVYGTLKLYMMLAEPARRDPAAMTNWFVARWHLFAPAVYNSNNRALFGIHLRELFSLAATPGLQPDTNLIRTARAKAAEISQQQRVLNRLKENATHFKLPDITLASAAGSEVVLSLRRKSNSTVNDIAVPAFYTRESYKDVVLPYLEEMSRTVLSEEGWVMNYDAGPSESISAVQRLMVDTRALYLNEYVRQWSSFVNDVRARPLQSIEDAAQLARQLGEPSSPLANLLHVITHETSMSERQSAGEFGWMAIQRVKRKVWDDISGEKTQFPIIPEDIVESRFQGVRRLTTSHIGNEDLTRSFSEFYNQLAALSIRLQSGEVKPKGDELDALKINAARQPEPVRSVMMDIILLGEERSAEQRRQMVSRHTASLAAGECRNVLSNRYPFVRTARAEVGIDDFARLFGRNGTFQTFFDQNLAPLVNTDQRPWRSHEKGMVTDSVLRAFENAARIRDNWFTQDDKPGFGFLLSPVVLSNNIAEATLDIDGQIFHYSHGQSQPVRIEWPGPKGGSYVRITFTTSDGAMQTAVYEGPWALLRFYDAASVSMRGQNTRELTMMLNGVSGSYSINIRALQQNFPLWSKNLRNFTCP